MALATLNLDTYKVVKRLQDKGYSEKEAEGFIAAIQETTLSGVATKQDIQDLRTEIQAGKNETLKFQIIQTIAIVGVMITLFQIFSATQPNPDFHLNVCNSLKGICSELH